MGNTNEEAYKSSKYLNTMDNIKESNHIIIHSSKKIMTITPSSSTGIKTYNSRNKKYPSADISHISSSMFNKRSFNLNSGSNYNNNNLEILTIHKTKRIKPKIKYSSKFNTDSRFQTEKKIPILNDYKYINSSFRKMSKTKCKYCKMKNVPEKLIKSHLFYCIDCYNKKKSINYKMDLESGIQPEICEIIKEKIFLGNVEAAANKKLLLENNVTSILVCGYLLNEYFPNDFNYLTLEFEDNDHERIFFPIIKGIEFILNNDCVFVHCRKGISRSSTIVIAYIMFHYKLNYDKAFKHVYNKKNNINPNENFKKQLNDFHHMSKLFNYDINMLKDYSSFYFSENKENKDEKEHKENKENEENKEDKEDKEDKEEDIESIKIHEIDE